MLRILQGMGSRLLPCGCLLGVYETYDGRTVAILDDRHRACCDASHQLNALIRADVRDASAFSPSSERVPAAEKTIL
jgi:hypothetical protein